MRNRLLVQGLLPIRYGIRIPLSFRVLFRTEQTVAHGACVFDLPYRYTNSPSGQRFHTSFGTGNPVSGSGAKEALIYHDKMINEANLAWRFGGKPGEPR